MSRLYTNEQGRVVPALCEEITAFRRARVTLDLPETRASGSLYLLAGPHTFSGNPLHLSINGLPLPSLAPDPEAFFKWYTVPVESTRFRKGPNTFVFWADSTAMNGWSLALESTGSEPRSALSDDGGGTWRSARMGYLNILSGEYVARVRLAEGHDPPPPQMIWENPRHPRVEQLLQRLPAGARRAGDVLTRIRALASWLSMSWEHTSSARAALYTPWDAETILAWGKTQTGPNGQRPIVMCVHYAVAFVSFCQALRIPARCAVLMGTPNGTDGHFVAEVWMDDLRKWIMVDPNCDVLFFKDGEPLSIPEIRSLGDSLEPYAVTGSGSRFQSTFPHMASFYRDNLFKGLCFRHRSVWPRTDFLSHPEYAPPGHGSTSYCETDLVWEETDLAAGFGMFRSFAPPEYFDAPPSMPH